MECVNCGKSGHTFRECKDPTSSYGVIAIRYDIDEDMKPRYLLIRRRDSLGYVDFIRGKYKLSDSEYIQLLIDQMTVDEKNRLLHQSFETLWVNVWNNQNTRQFRSEFDYAKKTFETLKTTGDIGGKILKRFLQESTTSWIEPEWGFPKGRRSPFETEYDCSIREFCEETGLRPKDITIRNKEEPEQEEYTGTNGIMYKHKYLIADCSSDVCVNLSNRVQTREVGDIGWFTFEEAYLKIRATNTEKREMLMRVHSRSFS